MSDSVKQQAQKRIHQAQGENRPIMDRINKAIVIARRQEELARKKKREEGETNTEDTSEGTIRGLQFSAIVSGVSSKSKSKKKERFTEPVDPTSESFIGNFDSLGKKVGKIARRVGRMGS